MPAFGVFTPLEISEAPLGMGKVNEAHGDTDNGWVHAGGWAGIVTAAVAWYTSAAGVVNGISPKPVLPVGGPLWRLSAASAPGSAPRREE